MKQQPTGQGRRFAGFVLVMLLAAGGCGSKAATITGTVRYRSRTLPAGTVSFYCENGEIISGLISADGTYRLPRVALGSARVAVVSHSRLPEGLRLVRPPAAFAPPPRGRSALASEAPRPATPIPEKYNRPDSSGLVFLVNSGEQTLDIELNP